MNRLPIVLTAVALGGCVATIGEPSGTPDPGGVIAGPAEALGCAEDARDLPGERLLRRLTGPQVERTIRSVFGFTTGDWSGHALPPDAAASNGFSNDASRLIVNSTYAARLDDLAEDIGELVATEPHRTRLSPCANGAAGAGTDCANAYLDSVGRALYRRPLTNSERDRYLGLLDTVMNDGELDTTERPAFVHWLKWATAALVASPHAVYRSELGGDAVGSGDARRHPLTGYERATAIAYTFTGAPPSDALLTLAENGHLDTPAGVEEATRALVLDGDGLQEVAQEDLLRFVRQWLGTSSLPNLVRDAARYPGFDDTIKDSMEAEFDAFVLRTLVDERGGGLEALLTAPHTYIDANLAAFYGFTPEESYDATGMARVARPEGWGLGLLALGAIQTVHAHADSTSPTKRGHLVRSRILCHEVPPPPPAVGDIPEPTGATTTRERYEDLHANNEVCAGCHSLMDPIGFGFEHLDPVGRYRADENGFTIDDTGSIVSIIEAPAVPFHGPDELAHRLAEDEETHACFVAFLASYAYGVHQGDTRCMTDTLATRFANGELTLPELLVGLSSTPHFLERR